MQQKFRAVHVTHRLPTFSSENQSVFVVDDVLFKNFTPTSTFIQMFPSSRALLPHENKNSLSLYVSVQTFLAAALSASVSVDFSFKPNNAITQNKPGLLSHYDAAVGLTNSSRRDSSMIRNEQQVINCRNM